MSSALGRWALVASVPFFAWALWARGQDLPSPEDGSEALERTTPPDLELPAPGIIDEEGRRVPGSEEDLFPREYQHELDRLLGGREEAGPMEEEATPSPGYLAPYLRGLFGLAFVLGLILLGYHLLRKYGRASPLFAAPEFGRVVGRIHLSPKANLVFVRTGPRILVLGVTQEQVTLLASPDASELQPTAPEGNPQDRGAESGADDADSDGGVSRFMRELQASNSSMGAQDAEHDMDADISSLRDEIRRLQQQLRESSREPRE